MKSPKSASKDFGSIHLKNRWTTLMFIILLWTTTACYFEENRSSLSLPYDQYSIDPENILESISRDKKNIFIPIESPSNSTEFQSTPVYWKQSDYLAIANSLHEVVWGESLDNWKINSVDFSMDCDEVYYGFQYARFVFFKIANDANGGYRIAHNIIIEPLNKSASTWAEKYSPLVMTWDEVDLSQIEITSDEAFQIAEFNGGSITRKSVNNNCSVSVTFNASMPRNGNWDVSYYSDEGNFNFQIDPITGKVK